MTFLQGFGNRELSEGLLNKMPTGILGQTGSVQNMAEQALTEARRAIAGEREGQNLLADREKLVDFKILPPSSRT